jgi:hypothetical protein
MPTSNPVPPPELCELPCDALFAMTPLLVGPAARLGPSSGTELVAACLPVAMGFVTRRAATMLTLRDLHTPGRTREGPANAGPSRVEQAVGSLVQSRL